MAPAKHTAILGAHDSGKTYRHTWHARQRQNIPLYSARMTAAKHTAIHGTRDSGRASRYWTSIRQLFAKHDKYVNRNRHDFMLLFNAAVATYVAGLTRVWYSRGCSWCLSNFRARQWRHPSSTRMIAYIRSTPLRFESLFGFVRPPD